MSELCGFLRSRLKLPALIVSMETRQAYLFFTRALNPFFLHPIKLPWPQTPRCGIVVGFTGFAVNFKYLSRSLCLNNR